MSDITSTCRAAWQQTKREHQPDYDDLVESYRTMLIARAEGVIATGSVSEDAPFQSFEKAVLDQPRPEIVDYSDDDSLGHPDNEPLIAEPEHPKPIRIEVKKTAPKSASKPAPKKATIKKPVKKATKKAAKRVAPKK